MKDKKSIADNMKDLEISWKDTEKPESDIFQDLQISKVASIKDIIEEINELIEKREKLSKDVFKDADAVQMELKNFSSDLGNITGVNSPHIPVLMEVRKKQAEIEELKMQEKINCWRDVAKLKEELRTYIKEAKDKEKRLAAMNQMME